MHLRLLPVVFHLLPLIPVFMGLPFASVAAFLLVAMPYIKVQKLTAELAQVRQGSGGKEKISLERTIRLWRALTFLKEPDQAGDESPKPPQDKLL